MLVRLIPHRVIVQHLVDNPEKTFEVLKKVTGSVDATYDEVTSVLVLVDPTIDVNYILQEFGESVKIVTPTTIH